MALSGKSPGKCTCCHLSSVISHACSVLAIVSLKPEEVFRTGLADGEASAPLSWNNASQLMEQPNGNRTHKTFTALAKLRLTRRATLSGMGVEIGGRRGAGQRREKFHPFGIICINIGVGNASRRFYGVESFSSPAGTMTLRSLVVMLGGGAFFSSM